MHDDSSPPLLVAAAALTRADGAVLVQRRPAGKAMAGLWEFPGGKIESGETPEAAVVRELAEELGVTVAVADLDPVAFGTDGRLVLLLYRVTRWTGVPVATAADAIDWVAPAALQERPMPPADRPLIRALVRA